MDAHIPALDGLPRYNSDGMGGMHLYVPWWLWDKKNKEFPRGYHIEIGGGFDMPGIGSFHGDCARHEGYGKDLKYSIRNEYGAWFGMAGRGEQIPNENTFCEIDPDVVDQYGIPVLRFHFQWTDHRAAASAAHARYLPIAARNHGRHGHQAAAEFHGGRGNLRRRRDHS